jgi:hypothetical protein
MADIAIRLINLASVACPGKFLDIKRDRICIDLDIKRDRIHINLSLLALTMTVLALPFASRSVFREIIRHLLNLAIHLLQSNILNSWES